MLHRETPSSPCRQPPSSGMQNLTLAHARQPIHTHLHTHVHTASCMHKSGSQKPCHRCACTKEHTCQVNSEAPGFWNGVCARSLDHFSSTQVHSPAYKATDQDQSLIPASLLGRRPAGCDHKVSLGTSSRTESVVVHRRCVLLPSDLATCFWTVLLLYSIASTDACCCRAGTVLGRC